MRWPGGEPTVKRLRAAQGALPPHLCQHGVLLGVQRRLQQPRPVGAHVHAGADERRHHVVQVAGRNRQVQGAPPRLVLEPQLR